MSPALATDYLDFKIRSYIELHNFFFPKKIIKNIQNFIVRTLELAHEITLHTINKHGNAIKYINLSSDYLRRKYGKTGGVSYNHKIQCLWWCGFLYINERYSNFPGNEFTKSYRVTTEFLISTIQAGAVLNPRKNSNLTRNEQYHHDALKNLEIDYEVLPQILDSELSQQLELDEALQLFNLIQLVNGGSHITECNQGRIHSVITNLARKYRKLILYNGKPLDCVDVSCAQPFYALSLIPQDYLSDEFVEDICNGQFIPNLYEFASLGSRAELASIKQGLYMNTYFQPVPVEGGRYHDAAYFAFQHLYPNDLSAIEVLRDALGHDQFACRLQGLESCHMNAAIEELITNNPGKLFIRLHDAILCDPSDSELVENTIEAKAFEFFGKSPKVKVSTFNQ